MEQVRVNRGKSSKEIHSSADSKCQRTVHSPLRESARRAGNEIDDTQLMHHGNHLPLPCLPQKSSF